MHICAKCHSNRVQPFILLKFLQMTLPSALKLVKADPSEELPLSGFWQWLRALRLQCGGHENQNSMDNVKRPGYDGIQHHTVKRAAN